MVFEASLLLWCSVVCIKYGFSSWHSAPNLNSTIKIWFWLEFYIFNCKKKSSRDCLYLEHCMKFQPWTKKMIPLDYFFAADVKHVLVKSLSIYEMTDFLLYVLYGKTCAHFNYSIGDSEFQLLFKLHPSRLRNLILIQNWNFVEMELRQVAIVQIRL